MMKKVLGNLFQARSVTIALKTL